MRHTQLYLARKVLMSTAMLNKDDDDTALSKVFPQ